MKIEKLLQEMEKLEDLGRVELFWKTFCKLDQYDQNIVKQTFAEDFIHNLKKEDLDILVKLVGDK